MIVIDPMILQSVKRALDRDIYDKSTGTQNTEGNKNSLDIVNDMADFIKGVCGLKIGAQITVPVAVLFTKMDALMGEFKNRTVSMPSPHVRLGYFDYRDAREVDKDIREWLSVKGEDAFTNALKANFADFTFFGVSSYGDVPVSKNELNPIRPHRVLDPVLWLFAKNNFIKANGAKFNRIALVFRVFSVFFSLRHYIKIKVILAVLAAVLAVTFIVVPNARAALAAVPAKPAASPAAVPAKPASAPAASAKPAASPAAAGKTPGQLNAEAFELYDQKKYDAAVPLFRKAAEQGNAFAQYSLGYAYANGRGVPKDNEKAKEWYRKSAAQGDEGAKKRLAELGG
jgi:hypothetical protein